MSKNGFEKELKEIVKRLQKMKMDDTVLPESAIFAYMNTAYVATTAAIAHLDELKQPK